MQFRVAVVPAETSEYKNDEVLSCVPGLYIACYVDMYSLDVCKDMYSITYIQCTLKTS